MDFSKTVENLYDFKACVLEDFMSPSVDIILEFPYAMQEWLYVHAINSKKFFTF